MQRNGRDADYIRVFGSGHDIAKNYLHDTLGGSTVNPSPHIDFLQGWGPGTNNTGGASNVTFEANWAVNPAQWNVGGGPADNHIGSMEDMTGALTVKNNYFANTYLGLILDWTSGSGTFSALNFWGNTVDNSDGAAIEYDCSGACTISATAIQNNQFLDVGHTFHSYLCTFANNLTGYTITQNNAHMRSGAVGTNHCAYTGALQNLNADPLFVAPGTLTGTGGSSHIVAAALCDSVQNSTSISTCGDYHLQAASPDRTNGTDLSGSGVTTDYYGLARGTTPSIGAVSAVLPLTLTPPTLAFGNQTINQSSGPQVATLTNNTASTIAVSIAVPPTGFTQTNTCGASLAINTSCTISVTFTPTLVQAYSGNLTVTY